MLTSAIYLQAGFDDKMVSLICAPDAMAIYCKIWKDETCLAAEGDKTGTRSVCNNPEKFMILDCGGKLCLSLNQVVKHTP